MNIELDHFCGKCMTRISMSMADIVDLLVSEAPHRCACDESKWSAMKIVYEQVNGLREFHASILGGEITAFEFEIRPNETMALNLVDYGVPELADVIYIEYINRSDGLNIYATALDYGMRGVLPKNVVAVHGVVENLQKVENTALPEQEYSRIIAKIAWVDRRYDSSYESLFLALTALFEERYNEALVTANAAVETKLYELMYSVLSRSSSGKKIEDFLANQCTYSGQLNIMLPFVCDLMSLPKLPENIRGSLNRLRSLRNKVAHHGETKEGNQLTSREMGELISAATLAIYYLTVVSEDLTWGVDA